MQAPQNLASAHNAPAERAIYSNRAAVHDIFQHTGALLDSFRTELLTNTRARHKETEIYMRNLHQSVRDMLNEMRQNRKDTTNCTRKTLQGYMADLRAAVAGARREVDEELREVSRLRQRSAHELAQMRAKNARQQLEELADSRRKTARSLHSELCGFTADLTDQVSQTRKKFRQELGFAQPAPVKKKRAKHVKASQPQVHEEEPHKKHMPRNAKSSVAGARSHQRLDH